VTSLARPGGNVTGLSSLITEVSGKRLGLLMEAMPGIARIAVLLDMSNPALATQWREEERAARSLGLQPMLFDLRRPEDFGVVFDTAIKQRAEAAIIGVDARTQPFVPRIVDLSVMLQGSSWRPAASCPTA
jgi:putative ABC transport system substrate-binding protein